MQIENHEFYYDRDEILVGHVLEHHDLRRVKARKMSKQNHNNQKTILGPYRFPDGGSNILISCSKTIVPAQRGKKTRLRVATDNYYLEKLIRQ